MSIPTMMIPLYNLFTGGDDQDIYSGGDSSSSESAFADLINSDSDFADLYDSIQNDPSSLYDTIMPQESAFADLINSNPDFADFYNTVQDDPSSLYDTIIPEEEYEGIFGLGIGPSLKETFLGSGDKQGVLEQILLGKASGKEGGGNTSGGLAGLLSQVVGGGDEGGGLLNSPLLKMLLANYLTKRDDSPSDVVPVGTQGFAAGSGQGLGTMPDYRTFNIQPALMPGVGYANAPPPKMQQGGLSEGPGDITLARLEPGEFVMTRKATDNIGARNLYKLMKDAERMN